MTTNTREVVIVGAGPAGMALAYLLARRGIGVTVLESHQDFARAFRGEGLQQSGIDAFRQMGLGERLERLPSMTLKAVEMYREDRLVIRTSAASLGRDGARVVSQPAILSMLAEEAGKYPGFRLAMGVTVRGLVQENGRVVGVRADGPGGACVYRADLVIGADGRHSVTRKHGNFAELEMPQGYDVVWVKVPFPAAYPDHSTAVSCIRAGQFGMAFPTADGQLQVGFFVAKGGFQALRAKGAEDWTEELIARMPRFLAAHLRAHRDIVARATLLNVVCGRLTNWTAPGLLLIGDAAHPMSPVGGQGVNIALRDALVAANHLCPVLTAGGDGLAIDAATRQVQHERWPEVVAIQQMQQKPARMLQNPNRLAVRIFLRLMPLLLRTGLMALLSRKENRYMSTGVVPVRLTA
jgi:2-polyprenyl-6-methoxyphenol hydroxylase-like FAD-dependent oxidoreductase